MKFIIVIAITFLVLTWAPWLDDMTLLDNIYNSDLPRKDQTVDSYGNRVCNYSVKMFPLGRLITSCEGSHYVTFWGYIL